MSAFRSAGQRCSALRLLCVHESIADGVIEMVQGAARELKAGDPSELSTDVGPVIDQEAFDNIQRHILRLSREARVLVQPDATGTSAIPNVSKVPNLIAPHAFEVKSIAYFQTF